MEIAATLGGEEQPRVEPCRDRVDGFERASR
jgi:hypothetical protein